MKLPFPKRGRRVDRALDALGIMPKMRVTNAAWTQLRPPYGYPPAPGILREEAAILGADGFNSALLDRCLADFCGLTQNSRRWAR